MTYEPKLPDETVNYSREHPLKEFLKIGGALFAMLLLLYLVLGWSVDLLAERISPEFEQEIVGVLPSGVAQQTPSAVMEPIISKLHGCAQLAYDAKVSFSNSEEVNAYALPGGRIVLHRGLVEEMASENELVFILAHEMGHLKHRDHLRGMGRALIGLSLAALLGMSEAPDILGSSVQWGESRFSQHQERAADLFALDVLQCYYGHVGGATDFFERHQEHDPAAWLLFASHPELTSRIETLQHEGKVKGYGAEALAPPLVYEELVQP